MTVFATPRRVTRRFHQTALIPLTVALIALAGCSGGGGSEDDEDEPDVPDPVETGPAAIEGVWTGTATNPANGTTRAAMVVGNRAGDAILHVQAGVDSIVVRGNACCDGNVDGEGDGWTLVNQRKVLAPVNLQITDLINNAKALTGNVTVEGARYNVDLRQDADYKVPLSLDALAGTYTVSTSTGTWMNFSVSNTGAITGADSVSCQFSGQLRIPDPTHNLFEITRFQMSSCTGGGAVRNGTYTGMGYLKGHASETAPKSLSFILTGPLIFPMGIPGAASAAPNVTLSADAASVEYGGTTTLRWTVRSLSACTASGDWTGSQANAGTLVTAALTQTATYTLTCSEAGIVKSATTIVTVPPLPADPGDAGKATLTGVDSNQNGVRDDQERRVLMTHPPGPVRDLLIERVASLNEALQARADAPQASQVFAELFRNLECLYATDKEQARVLAIDTVAQFMNTPERASAYVDFAQAAGGAVVEARVPEQLTEDCF